MGDHPHHPWQGSELPVTVVAQSPRREATNHHRPHLANWFQLMNDVHVVAPIVQCLGIGKKVKRFEGVFEENGIFQI